MSLGSLVTTASGWNQSTADASAQPSISSSPTLATTATRPANAPRSSSARTPWAAAAIDAFWSQMPSP